MRCASEWGVFVKIKEVEVKNFKSVDQLKISEINDVLILVGRNHSGKSVIMDALRVVTGNLMIDKKDFHSDKGNISISVKLEFSSSDLEYLHKNGVCGKARKYEAWKNAMKQKLPSFIENNQGGGILTFEYTYGRDGSVRYRDGSRKNNPYIKEVLPKIYYVDHYRNQTDIKEDLIMFAQDNGLTDIRDNKCIFDSKRKCNQCFDCIGIINKKSPQDLTLLETSRLLQFKMFNLNLNAFAEKLNVYFAKNGGCGEKIRYEIQFDVDKLFQIETIVENPELKTLGNLDSLGEGIRSIYTLSLLETYVETKDIAPYIIMIEDPETYLHPHLQKVASRILYRLSKKNQVIFSTHEPEMLFNFSSKNIKQVYSDDNYCTQVVQKTDIDSILNDLGYTANDLMNVSFVFIVEGKQDRSRLPLLLNKYYSEIYDENQQLRRIAILSTNSCTNIKTYANLKYINTLYLKDQFMMIRDSDGKDRNFLGKQLCKYYGDREKEDKGHLPRVTERNVLILKYYSFENYFLFPEVMAKVGIVKSVDQFYDILWSKYQKYLYKLSSVKNMLRKLNIRIESRQDVIDNIENIRIYVRGHNLYDIFYGRYKSQEEHILAQYIDAAPREIFKDILDKIDDFVYFNSRKL